MRFIARPPSVAPFPTAWREEREQEHPRATNPLASEVLLHPVPIPGGVRTATSAFMRERDRLEQGRSS